MMKKQNWADAVEAIYHQKELLDILERKNQRRRGRGHQEKIYSFWH